MHQSACKRPPGGQLTYDSVNNTRSVHFGRDLPGLDLPRPSAARHGRDRPVCTPDRNVGFLRTARHDFVHAHVRCKTTQEKHRPDADPSCPGPAERPEIRADRQHCGVGRRCSWCGGRRFTLNVSCALPGGSSVPLGFLYAYLAGAAPNVLAENVASNPWTTDQSREGYIDAIIPIDGDLFEILPSGTATYSVICALDNSAIPPATLTPLRPLPPPHFLSWKSRCRERQFSAFTTTGAPVPITLTDPGAAAGASPTSATVPADGQTHTLSIGPAGPGLVISAPANDRSASGRPVERAACTGPRSRVRSKYGCRQSCLTECRAAH